MKKSMITLSALGAALWLFFWLSACSNNNTSTYSIGGTTTGLSGTIVLQCNGEDDLSMDEDGEFTFATPLKDGNDYDVTILSAPSTQTCTISNNTGTLAGADVTDVAVSCISKFSIGGTVSGLSGTLVLQNNGEDDLSIDADGTFAFATLLEDGSDYAVNILSAPPMQSCTISSTCLVKRDVLLD